MRSPFLKSCRIMKLEWKIQYFSIWFLSTKSSFFNYTNLECCALSNSIALNDFQKGVHIRFSFRTRNNIHFNLWYIWPVVSLVHFFPYHYILATLDNVPFLTCCLRFTYRFQISMQKYVLMMTQAVVIFKNTCLILELQKSEDLQNEDFLSILYNIL